MAAVKAAAGAGIFWAIGLPDPWLPAIAILLSSVWRAAGGKPNAIQEIASGIWRPDGSRRIDTVMR